MKIKCPACGYENYFTGLEDESTIFCCNCNNNKPLVEPKISEATEKPDKEASNMGDIRCNNCKHRLPKYFCGYQQSAYYNKKINPRDYCEFFVENSAEEHFKIGLKEYEKVFSMIEEGKTNEEIVLGYSRTVKELELAISLDLPEDDEMDAKVFLGSCYIEISKLEFEKYMLLEECLKGVSYIEQAAKIDKKGSYGIFIQPDHAIFIKDIDAIYYYNEIEIKEKEGIEAAINYASEKLELFDYLPENPLLHLLFQIGNLYAQKGNYNYAINAYKSIINSKFWDIHESYKPEYDEIKITAQHNLNICIQKM